MKPGDAALIVVTLLLVELFADLPMAAHAALLAVQVLVTVRLYQARRASRR
jgi:hypothetical protein